MSLLKVIPVLTVIGAASLLISKTIKKRLDREKQNTQQLSKQQIIDKIKECQNELARLHDLKILNDKRESTGQIKKIDIMIDDLTLEETIKNYEDEISFLIKHSNLK
jgi:predicted RNA-binding protein